MKTLRATLIAIVFCSCSRTYYAPTNANIPLLREKGEVSLSGGFAEASGSSAPAGAEVQLAFSPKERLAFMFNFATLGAHGQSDQGPAAGNTLVGNPFSSGGQSSSTGRGSGTYLEIGAGSFTRLGATKWVAEGYAGVGRCWINTEYASYGKGRVNYTRVFLQPNIGYRSKNFEFGFSPRLSYVNRELRENNYIKTSDMFTELELIGHENSKLKLEPTFSLKVGFPGTKLFYTQTISGGEETCWSHSYFAIGLAFRILPEKKTANWAQPE